MKSHDIKPSSGRLGASRPSSVRVRAEGHDARVREDERIKHFEGSAVSSARETARKWNKVHQRYIARNIREEHRAQAVRRSGLSLGGAVLLVSAALALGSSSGFRDTEPIDVDKLPKDQVTRYVPPAGENPEEIARQVTNGDTDIDQLTAEIQAQMGDSSGLNEAVLLPNTQIDPSLIKK